METLPFLPGDTLILTSDGIVEQLMMPAEFSGRPWNADELAEVILAECGIAMDDASVLVCRALAGATKQDHCL